KISDIRVTSGQKEELPDSDKISVTDFKAVPQKIKEQTKTPFLEYADVTFKTRASTGDQYVDYVSKDDSL
ncbi:hypothetical protein CHS0354_014272, partial [Potamilus streckersoni]